MVQDLKVLMYDGNNKSDSLSNVILLVSSGEKYKVLRKK